LRGKNVDEVVFVGVSRERVQQMCGVFESHYLDNASSSTKKFNRKVTNVVFSVLPFLTFNFLPSPYSKAKERKQPQVSFSTTRFCMSVLEWVGEELARMDVRASDKVLVGMQQIEEELGVPPCRQRLVFGERQLVEDERWSVCGVLDWSTVQLTIVFEETIEEEYYDEGYEIVTDFDEEYRILTKGKSWGKRCKELLFCLICFDFNKTTGWYKFLSWTLITGRGWEYG